MDLHASYRGRNVLITGGLGFIGSNLAHKMVKLDANVTLMDSRIEGLGANDFNLVGIEERVTLDESDIRDPAAVNRLVANAQVIFDLAAQVDYKRSNREPVFDASINFQGHMNVIEACRTNPGCRIVFPGSRTQYGRVTEADLPVKEDHPLEILNPPSAYTLNKTAIEMLLHLVHKVHGLDSVVLRLTNPFGPRAQIKNSSYCVLNWFIGQALQGKPLTVFGEGEQLRDYAYIDDVVDAFAVAGVHPNPKSRVYNIGSGEHISFKAMTAQIAELTGAEVKHIPYPKSQKGFETGDFYADVSRAKEELGWEPAIGFKEGLKRTVDYYREHLAKYA